MSKLHEIAAQRRKDVEAAKVAVSIEQLKQLIASKSAELGGEPLNLATRMNESPPIAGARMHVAAEFKRASPSKGAMAAETLSVEEQVTTYVHAGSSMVSVLTEPKWFKGSLEDMETAKRTILKLNPSVRPLVLRKDFLVDTYQLYEARAYGADTVLLIVAILTDDELKSLITQARALGMEPLVEAANEPETQRALSCGARVLGINNRDLTTFKVDLATTSRCAEMIPADAQVSVLALSGLKGREDVIPYEPNKKIRGVLVGEHLMRCENPVEEIRALVVDVKKSSEKPLVKVCGMVRIEDVLAACRAKADFIGIIFADKSPRKVEVDEARNLVQAIRDFRETRGTITLELPTANKDQGPKRARMLSEWFTETAERLRKACTRGPLSVGVFMDQPIDVVNETVRRAGLDLVQLHGKESAEECSRCIVPVIKVVHVPVVQNLSDADIVDSIKAYEGHVVGILLDTTVKGGAEGGTGVAFDWDVAARYKSLGVPVFVAGGLTPDNITKAIAQSSHPLAMDCSSGVQKSEKTPREKDSSLIQIFVERVKAAL